ncbi:MULTISPECIES: cell wall hydrolase [Bacteroidales]|uniref:cell wall hydrolase n=1 Tax=Bacteroidales TaxID=171549 RepID=UPI0025959A93|nr:MULTISPECIES: cell wall hydrolase [Bacteroidales]
MRKVTMIAALLLSVIMFFHSDISVEDEVVYAGNVTVHNVVPEPIFIDASPIVTIKPLEEEEESLLPYEDISLIALVTMAEAEGECEDGKRLVIDAILNRMDSEHFPDNVYDVIYQRNQFSSIWNGRVDRCEVRDDICQLVEEELLSRTNTDVIFFTAGEYSKYGVPMFQLGNHYFSSYE